METCKAGQPFRPAKFPGMLREQLSCCSLIFLEAVGTEEHKVDLLQIPDVLPADLQGCACRLVQRIPIDAAADGREGYGA